MPSITAAAVLLGVCKLTFSLALLVYGKFQLGLGAGELQTLALVTLVFGNQGVLFVLRERRRLWSSRPSPWVLASSAADVGLVSALALSGTLMQALPWQLLAEVLTAAAVFALVLDQIKLPIIRAFKVQ
jgi:H+-transporting ATPase